MADVRIDCKNYTPRRVVEMELKRPPQGHNSFEDFAIDVVASIGPWQSSDNGIGFIVNFSKMFLDVEYHDCMAKRDGSYELKADKAVASVNIERSMRRNGKSSLRGVTDIGVISRWIQARFRGDFERGSSFDAAQNFEQFPDIKIVSPTTSHRWVIGPDFGDPRNYDCFLCGKYITTSLEEFHPLCRVEPRNAEFRSYSVELTLKLDLMNGWSYQPQQQGLSLKLSPNKRKIEELLVKKLLKEKLQTCDRDADSRVLPLAHGSLKVRKVEE